MSDNENTKEQIIQAAILQELVDRTNKHGLFHSKRAFEVTVEPNEPYFAVTYSPRVTTEREVLPNLLECAIDPFARKCERKKSGTFRATYDDASTLHLRANTWEDLIGGLNKALSEKNQIDPNILGRGK